MRNRQERWQNKALHGQYLNDTDEKKDCEITCNWLKNGYLKKETKGFIMATQDKTSSDSKYRLCKVKEETIYHLISSCSKIAQTDYKERHDRVALVLHWNICRKYNLPTAEKWWEHKVDKVLQKQNVKILWDFKIQTDKHLEHNTIHHCG